MDVIVLVLHTGVNISQKTKFSLKYTESLIEILIFLKKKDL